MKFLKTSPNVEFDVIYEDGTRYHASEGVLFEARGNNMVLHLGTNRVEVLFAVAECLTETVKEAGLEELFFQYIDKRFDDEQAVNSDA